MTAQVLGWEQIQRKPYTATEIAVIEKLTELNAAWDEIDKVQEMIDGGDQRNKPYQLMIDALARAEHAQSEYDAAWQANNAAKAARLAE